MDGNDILHTEALLQEKEKELHGKDDHLGLTLMTFPQYISATRSTMFTNHLKQFLTLNDGEFPKVFTGYENIFGKHSTSIVKAKHDYQVIARVEKYEDMPGHIYALFLYDKKNNKYDVVFRKISENLTEKYGYKYNNDSLDRLQEGDMIHKGDLLYKSSSYDEDNDYCYGLNARIAYLLDPGNVEDAYVISESFAARCVSRKTDSVKVSINDNDFLLNLYGDSKHHKGFPDIGEDIRRHIVTCKRRIFNDQILYDMKKSNMMKINPYNDKPFYGKGFITDIDIYCNKDINEIPETEYNEQLLYYLRNQERYYKEINKICQMIESTGAKRTNDLNFVMGRSREILDPNYKWKDNNGSEFSNMVIEFQIDRDVPLFSGSKITGRYGDKGVISEIRPDHLMPYTLDKKGNKHPVDVIANPLSCPNRLNPFQWIEMSLTHDAEHISEDIRYIPKAADKWKYLMNFMKYFNERGEVDQLKEYYNDLDKKGKEEFWRSVESGDIFINYPPMWEGMPAIDKIQKIAEEFGVERDDVYVHMHGRDIKLMRKVTVGYKYMMKLKQDTEKNFSARSTGSLSQQGVPEKSNKIRTNEMLYSTTPVTLGRDENNNLGIGVSPFMLAKMHLFYRTSPFARRQVGKLYTTDTLNFDKFKIKPGYRNRNVEHLNAKLKSLGAYIDFGFHGLTIDVPDDSLHVFDYKGKIYVDTNEGMREYLLEELMRKNFAKYRIKGTKKEIEKAFQEFKECELRRAQGILEIEIAGEQKFDK